MKIISLRPVIEDSIVGFLDGIQQEEPHIFFFSMERHDDIEGDMQVKTHTIKIVHQQKFEEP